MAFKRLNGWTLPFKIGSGARVWTPHAEPGDALTGQPRRGRRAIRRTIRGVAPSLSAADADTLEGLLLRRGWYFPLETSLRATRGQGAEAGSTVTFNVGGGPLGDDGYASITDAVFDLDLPDRYTIGWHLLDGSWARWWLTDDGKKWEDGVRNDAASITYFTISDGGLAISGPVDLAGLLILPFRCSVTAIEEWDAWMAGGRRFSDVPRLWLDGDDFDEIEVIPELDGRQRILQHGGAGGWENNARDVPFLLHKVDPRARETIARPDWGWSFADRFVSGSTVTAASPSAKYTANVSGITTGQDGPYGASGEAATFPASALSYPSAIVEEIEGRTGVSFLGWFKIPDESDVKGAFSLDDGTQYLFAADFNLSVWEAGIRAVSADSPYVLQATLTGMAGAFHLYGATFDLVRDLGFLTFDGRIVATVSGLGLSQESFGDASSGEFLLGETLGAALAGDLAAGHLYFRALSPREHREVFRLGRRGLFL